MVVNILLTVPLAFWGSWALSGRRRSARSSGASIGCPWPAGECVGTSSTFSAVRPAAGPPHRGRSAASCFGIQNSVHLQGALGLVFCALGTLPALLVFVLLVFSSRRSVARTSTAIRQVVTEGGENDGHAVMDGRHRLVSRGGEDRAPTEWPAVGVVP